MILNAAGEGIYGLDLQGRAKFVNPAAAQMTGHHLDELLGRSMHELVHHSHADGRRYEREACPIYAAFTDGHARKVGDEVFWRKDGSCFPVDYTSTPILAAGRLVGSVVVFRDATQRRYVEDKLCQALAEVQRLQRSVQRSLHPEKPASRARTTPHHEDSIMVGRSAALAQAVELARRAATTDVNVLVSGESGTGKELVARAIHDCGPRSKQPFVSVNCAALAPSLIESELFGHERGAFTGATSQRIGRFEQAGNGTLFLDEIGELPLELQGKLLRVIETREFERVGGTRTLAVNSRLVAATNRDLRQLVQRGRFRLDLYFRLHVLHVHVPPLRQRREDIPLLLDHFLRRCQAKWNRPTLSIEPSHVRQLLAYDWPGNVRELEHAVERAVLCCDGPLLTFDVCGGELESSGQLEAPQPGLESLDAAQRAHILRALERSAFRIAGPHGAAALLGIHPNTLRYRMNKLGITRPPSQA